MTRPGMTLSAFLDQLIDDGIKACSESYKDHPLKHKGAIAGFETCRGRTVFELRQQLDLARKLGDVAAAVDRENYWYHRCRYAEIEWVCNVVSACLQNEGVDPIVAPTARGFIKAAEILGVRGDMTLKEFRDLQEN